MIVIKVNKRIIQPLEKSFKDYDVVFTRIGNTFSISSDNDENSFTIGRIYQVLVDKINKEDEQIQKEGNTVRLEK